jgi:hypothetical protein
MARKPARRPAAPRKPAKKAAKQPAKKAARATSTAKKPASPVAPAYPGSPVRVSTGTGASPEQIGRQVVTDFNKGHYEINTKLWSTALECVEGGGLAWRGLKNVESKNNFWNSANAVLGASAEGPYVGSTGFAIKFRMDVEDKNTRRRTIMEEVGVYSVKDGKIVREEFMYGSVLPAEAAMPEPLTAQ